MGSVFNEDVRRVTRERSFPPLFLRDALPMERGLAPAVVRLRCLGHLGAYPLRIEPALVRCEI